jgi:hypothetical protein
MTLGYTFEGANYCPDCFKDFLRKKKKIEDVNEHKWLLDGSDRLGGKMNKWPVRDAEGDYVRIDLRELRKSLREDEETPALIYNLNGAQVYYTNWRPRHDDPVRDIDDEITAITEDDKDDYEEEGLDCNDCGKPIIEALALFCIHGGCKNVLTRGKNRAKVEAEYSEDEQFCKEHFAEFMEFLEEPIIARISAMNRENPSSTYEDALFRLASDSLEEVYEHFLRQLTLADELEKWPRWEIVQLIKEISERDGFEKPWTIFEFDIEKVPCYKFVKNLEDGASR